MSEHLCVERPPCQLLQIWTDLDQRPAVPAWYVEGGLAICFDPAEGAYAVTHVASGCRVTPLLDTRPPGGLEVVRNLQLALLALVDWTRDHEDLKADEALRAAVRAAVDALP